jgi:CBS domain-containing protein
MKSVTVKDVMTTRVVSMRKDASFREMAAALREHRSAPSPSSTVTGALGSEPQGMPGMITGLLRRKEHAKARGVTAGELMSGPPVTVTPDDTVEHAAKLMYARKVKRLPVVDSGTHLVGLVSRADVLAIFDRKDGVVTLGGRPESSDVGHELVRRIRHVPGVVAIRDRLSYPPRDASVPSFDVLARFASD